MYRIFGLVDRFALDECEAEHHRRDLLIVSGKPIPAEIGRCLSHTDKSRRCLSYVKDPPNRSYR